jgi:isopentenyl-diphosphate delta-isomerase
LTGKYIKDPKPNPDEVMATKWVKWADLKIDIEKNPQVYSYWFPIAFRKLDQIFSTLS